MEPITLVCMRLNDMWKLHPEQVTMECVLCKAAIGVYPSGQKALRLTPGPIRVICTHCASKEIQDGLEKGDEVEMFKPAAETIDELEQEMRDSVPVTKQ